MRPFIRKGKSKSGATTVQVEFKRGRIRERIVHVGSAHNEVELQLLINKANEIIDEGQLVFDLGEQSTEHELYLERSYSKTLWDALEGVYNHLGFNQIEDEVFKQLVLARIIEPTSKLETIRVLDELGLDAPSNTTIHRSLKRSIEADYRSIISDACFLATTKTALRLVLYDVTTLYFEAQKEDDFRKPGLSKERKLDPQIVVGLLVDRRGFPLEVMSFEGNTAEVKTIEPVLSSFIKRHGLAGITVAADAAMLSSANITALEQMGYTYIIASKMTRFPLEIENYLNISPDTVLKDGQIFESKMSVTVNGKRTHRRCVYQYRKKRADLDLRNIEKSVAKATKMIEGKADVKRNRFLQLTGGIRELNVSLIETHKKRAGIKGYLTNLKISAEEVITAYHQLFEVEKSFRMSKSDLRARPIFHHTRQSIEAHLTIVFAALAISRYIESKTSVSIKRFVKALLPIRTGVIVLNGKSHHVKPRLTERAAELLDLLG